MTTAKSFAQTLRLMATSRAMVEHDDFATEREVYYISKNWGDCRFDDQAESDATMDDIEAMASMHALSREQLRFYSESHGGSVAGRLTVVDRNPVSGATVESTAPISAAAPTASRARSSISPSVPMHDSCSPSKPAVCFSA